MANCFRCGKVFKCELPETDDACLSFTSFASLSEKDKAEYRKEVEKSREGSLN